MAEGDLRSAPGPSAHHDMPPGTMLGHYRITKKIGEGGMGVVYHAVDTTLERPVAIKVMRAELATPDFKARFLREAKAAAQVSHPNVVIIHQAGEIGGALFMAFEFVSGGDLSTKLRGGALEPREAARIAIACAAGLDAIHRAGLIHRDIKPQNIFLDDRGHPKLGDLGLARSVGGDDRMTVTGVTMGTPAYMSPEQIEGHADIDIRSDIHALGGVLFAMLAGRAPFEGATPYSITHKVMTGDRPKLRDVNPAMPERLQRVILKAMACDRKDRHQTPKEFIDDILGRGQPAPVVLDGGSRSLAPAATPKPLQHPLLSVSRSRPWMWPTIALVCMLAIGGTFLVLHHPYRGKSMTILTKGTTAVLTPAPVAPPAARPTAPSDAVSIAKDSKQSTDSGKVTVAAQENSPITHASEINAAHHSTPPNPLPDSASDHLGEKSVSASTSPSDTPNTSKGSLIHDRAAEIAVIHDRFNLDDAKSAKLQKLIEEFRECRNRVLRENEGGSPQANMILIVAERNRIVGKAAPLLTPQQEQAFTNWLTQMANNHRHGDK